MPALLDSSGTATYQQEIGPVTPKGRIDAVYIKVGSTRVKMVTGAVYTFPAMTPVDIEVEYTQLSDGPIWTQATIRNMENGQIYMGSGVALHSPAKHLHIIKPTWNQTHSFRIDLWGDTEQFPGY